MRMICERFNRFHPGHRFFAIRDNQRFALALANNSLKWFLVYDMVVVIIVSLLSYVLLVKSSFLDMTAAARVQLFLRGKFCS